MARSIRGSPRLHQGGCMSLQPVDLISQQFFRDEIETFLYDKRQRMIESESSGTDPPVIQDGAMLPENEDTNQKPKPSLIRRFFGAIQSLMDLITLSNLTKVWCLWMLLPVLFPSQDVKVKPSSSPVSHSKQHFRLEPIGFTTSLNTERRNGYYMKDVATWEAFEKKGLARAEPSATPLNTNLLNTSVASDAATRITSEFDDVISPIRMTQKLVQSHSTSIVLDIRPGNNVRKDIAFLRHAVTFLVGMIRDRRAADKNSNFEVMIVFESAGGPISAYGLLAEQLRRLRMEPGLTLTVLCDQNALSGGYLLASLASPGQLFAAPFASIGSIGVVSAEVLNFHDALEKIGIKPIRFHGGQWKAPMTRFGDISEEEAAHMQEHIDSFHEAFRAHVQKWRGDVIKDYEYATSGSYWLGAKAKELGLVDRLITSDEYIDEKIRNGHPVFKIVEHKNEQRKGVSGILDILAYIISPPSTHDDDTHGEFDDHHVKHSLLFEGLDALQSVVNAAVDHMDNSK